MELGPLIFSERANPFVLPANRVADSDTVDDFDRAKWIYQVH